MDLAPLFLDAGNLMFFVSTFPQLIKTFRNRNNPEALKGISALTLLGFMISTALFISAGVILSAPLTIILGLINEVTFGLQLFWKRRLNKID